MKSLIFSIVMLLPLLLGAQENWYVGTTGNDGNNGHTPTNALATFPQALDRMNPGDTLNILGGIYYNAGYGNGDRWKREKTLSITGLHASPDAYTVIRPYNDEEVTLRGDGLYIVHARNSSYLRIEGLEIEGEVNNIPLDTALAYQFAYRENGSTEVLFRVPFGTPPEVVENMTFPILDNIQRPTYTDTKGLVVQVSHHVDIVNNHIHHMPGSGVRAQQCDYVRMMYNEVDNCSRKSYSGTHALVFDSSTSIDENTGVKSIIEGNEIHHNYNEIYSWSPSKNIITPHIDEGKGISLQRNDLENGWEFGRILVKNNLTYWNGFSGLHSNNGRGIDFINNTSYYDSYTGSGNNHGLSFQRTVDASAINNIIVNDPSAEGFGMAAANSSDLIVRNNLVFGRVDSDIEDVMINTLTDNPLFVDPANFDFSLSENSPAIDVALGDFAPALDFTGAARETAADLGAFEYRMISSVEDEAFTPLQVFPNPFQDFIYLTPQERVTAVAELYDLSGRRIKRIKVSPNTAVQRIDLPGLPAGTYVLKYGRSVQRLIKQ